MTISWRRIAATSLGSVVRDMLYPDSILIGEGDSKAGDMLQTIYLQMCEKKPPVQRMNWVSAELTKISVNTYVTTKISYANMLADICDRLPGADTAGMAGLADRTNYHWGSMLKAALVSTLLGVGAEFGASDEDRLVQAARAGTQDSFNETGRQVVERQLRIPPTITIRPGFALRVIVTRDLILEPLRGSER